MSLTEKSPYILISRSFAQSDSGALSQDFLVPYINTFSKKSLLEGVIDDLSCRYPIVALGTKDIDPEAHASNALYLIEMPNSSVDWTDVFMELATNALCVLIIPGNTEGFLKEIEILKSNELMSKTFLFMFPSFGFHKDISICNHPEQWSRIVLNMKDNGFNLPDHLNSGAILVMDKKLNLAQTEALTPKSSITEVLDKMTSQMKGTPLENMAIKIRYYEIKSGNEKVKHMWEHIRKVYNK